jgi:PAS domain-containing protein
MDKTDERIEQLENEVRTLKAELEQGRNYRYLLQAFDNISDCMLYSSVRDLQTEILRFEYISDTCEEVFGVKNADALADIRNVFRYYNADDLKALMQQIKEVDTVQKKFEVEARYNHPVKGAERWIRISSYPRLKGNQIYSNGLILDVTDQKEA